MWGVIEGYLIDPEPYVYLSFTLGPLITTIVIEGKHSMIFIKIVRTGVGKETQGKAVMRYSLLNEDEAKWYTKFRRKIKHHGPPEG